MKKPKLLPHLINAGIWLALIGGLFYFVFKDSPSPRSYLSLFQSTAEKETGQEDLSRQEPTIQPATSSSELLEFLPEKIENATPFIPQAPYKVWDHLHDEACEEAALITAHYYLKGQKKLPIKDIEEEIQALVKYQQENYGEHKDLTAKEMVTLSQEFYGDQLKLVESYTLLDLKKYLAQGSIIVAPAAGRVLENPYFRQPGPLYHALAIIGYDDSKQQFITNDPGTKRGAGFRYSYSNLLESIHDFPGQKEDILNGAKTVILVEK